MMRQSFTRCSGLVERRLSSSGGKLEIGKRFFEEVIRCSSIQLSSYPLSSINTTRCFSSNSTKQGLFSIPNLHQPSDFLHLATEAISKCDSLRDSIRSSLSSPSVYLNDTSQAKDTLATLDEISNTICSVIDASELCRSVHSDKQWRDAAGQAFQLLSEYIAELNADVNLYQSLVPITSNLGILSSQEGRWTEEDTRFALAMKHEFERDGIHLSDEKRAEIQKLAGFVVQLESLFTQNTQSYELFDVENELCSDVKNILPRKMIEEVIPQSNDGANSITISTDDKIVNTLLRYSPSSSLRKDVYIRRDTSAAQNIDVLDALIAHRHEFAAKLGYKSYADYFLKDKMSQNPANVDEFLRSMSSQCSSQYKRDMKVLQSVKNQVEGTTEPLEPWDLNYYMGMMKTHMASNGNHQDLSSSLVGYFTVEQSIDAMKMLVRHLFGITMMEVPMLKEERWDGTNLAMIGASGDNVMASSLLQKFEFVEEESGDKLGTLYLDLFPREGKYTHNAHFTVTCGKRANTQASCNGDQEEHQLPVVALVCNLSPPPLSSSFNAVSNAAILSHSEVETLFHEFGHGLHSLLSRTAYQHLSGTRAAMDFVETPSHLMEYYVWDQNFLSILGRHHVTGESLSPDLIQMLIRSRYAFKAIDIQTQTVYAKFDQAIFGDPALWKDKGMSTMDVFASLNHQNDVLIADGTHWFTKFGHLVTYGAGYYSYLYCSSFAADLWKQCFGGGGSHALRRDVGLQYWKSMLIHGGSQDPNIMLKSMLGREPEVDSFLQFLKDV